jgi:hypothetical protein
VYNRIPCDTISAVSNSYLYNTGSAHLLVDRILLHGIYPVRMYPNYKSEFCTIAADVGGATRILKFLSFVLSVCLFLFLCFFDSNIGVVCWLYEDGLACETCRVNGKMIVNS